MTDPDIEWLEERAEHDGSSAIIEEDGRRFVVTVTELPPIQAEEEVPYQ